MRLAPVMRSKLMRPKLVGYTALLSSVLFGVAVSSVQRGLTQSAPTCDPPGANEYLLLVINQQSDTEEQLRQLLPENAVIVSCQYLDDPVVRVGGFANAEIAEAWAKYVTDTAGLQAFVAGSTADTAAATTTATTTTPADPAPADESLAFPTPTQTPSAESTSSPTPTGTTTSQNATSELPSLNQAPDTTTVAPDSGTPDSGATPSTPPPSPSATAPSPNPSTPGSGSANPVFAPKPLGSGYAVLVNFANRPEVAADVQQVTSQPVGLVSYNQRPFLLATHTTDPTAATAVLQALNDRGFSAILIDSRNAVLLTPAVVGTGG